MEYLYHRVPKHMTGTILYPLNVLKETQPEIYVEHVKKYEGREILLTSEVPPLNCLWNDVIHLTAVSPQELKANLALAEIEYQPQSWFKIPTSHIEGENGIAFVYRRDLGLKPEFKHYEKFNPTRMSVYRTVPAETIEQYKMKKAEGVKPLLFSWVPHVLYKGEIDVSSCEIITV